ncbi:KDO2-lipid IV(A) lauroyltransferase [Lewinella marina]|uniref:Lipid A biosynthesis acyltransferase n=1 Tax=Neolewinella marina TaxID=438751 RepID=A0A2G0CJB4_9BACT|nr:lysophospholipid acyltransferase family protein [Neolewinella marina]NJB84774.1 KDO2-lipid IV(A) lauroyltransferase [Neolewinella marina]PHL00067.1 hypothetical protein CGL56_03235 [Neolewinella marina]
MAYLLYYLILLPLSYLPWSVLYGIGSALAALNWRWVGYRKEVVLDNLRRSLPDRSEAEILALGKAYYIYFFETIAESIKLFSLDEAAAVRRCRILNPEAVDHLRAQGRSFIAYGGHYSNWEMAGISFPSQLRGFTLMAIYAPLKDRVMDRLVTANRQRAGVLMVPRKGVEDFYEHPPVSPTVDFFVADQAPSNARWEKLHWTTFLGRTTGFMAGPERYAVRYDRPVYYMTLRREGRGQYVAELLPVTDTPRQEAPGFITEAFARQLEREIQRDPVPWLWSHRRWKREVPPEVVRELEHRPFVPPVYDRSLRVGDSDRPA